MRKQALFTAMAIAGSLFTASNVEAGLIPGANSPILYGYSVQDGGIGLTNQTTGFSRFSAEGGFMEAFAEAPVISDLSNGGYINGKFYAVRSSYNWLSGTTYYVDVYDGSSWELLSSNKIDSYDPKGIAFNEDGTKLYVKTSVSGNTIIRAYDLSTYESEDMAEIPGWIYFTAIGNGPDGKISMLGEDGLLIMDPKRGEYVKHPVDFTINRSSVTYDAHSGLVYITNVNPEDYLLHVISYDLKTDKSKDLGPVEYAGRVQGLSMPTYATGVFSPVTDVALDYAAPGSSDCTISFKLPTGYYGGKTFSGTVSAVVDIDGVSETFEGKAGSTVTVSKKLSDGLHYISIFAKNDKGNSPERRFKTYTGLDYPSAVSNVLLEISEEGAVTLKWNAPTTSVNGGTFDTEDLSYNIIRYPAGIEVATNLKGTSFKENLGDAFGNYYYSIIPVSGGLAGPVALSNVVKSGSIYVPTFLEGFDYYQDFDMWTKENPLDNGYGWQAMSGGAFCNIQSSVTSDYYLFTPEIRLSADETYTLSFDYKPNGWGDVLTVLDVYICKEPDSSADADMLFEELTLTEDKSFAYFKDFKVNESGIYYICFHDITPMGGNACVVDNFAIKINSKVSAPAQVSGLKAEAGEKGAETATLTFTLPTTNENGSALTSISKVIAWNETTGANVVVKENARPGETIVWTDENAEPGINNYGVAAYSGDEKGMSSHVSLFVGVDLPKAVSNVCVVEENGAYKLSWTAPSTSGIHGGYVDIEALTYNISRCDSPEEEYAWTPVIARDVAGCEYVDEDFEMPEDKMQKVIKYVVKPVYDSTEGQGCEILYTAGAPYILPYADSFSSASYQTDGWIPLVAEGAASWSLENGYSTTVKPFNADAGMLKFVNAGMEPSSATIRMPRVLLGTDAMIGFEMNHGFDVDPGDIELTVLMQKADGEISEIATVDYNDGNRGWAHHAFSLGSFDTPEDAMIILKGFAYDGSAPIFIDNLKIYRGYANDMEMLDLNVPASAEVGATEAVVKVFNAGKNDASFDVALFKNNEEVSRESVENLAAGASKIMTIDMALRPGDALETLSYYAEIIFAEDQNEDNNTSAPAEVFVKRNTIPAVELEGEYDETTVSLSWEPASTTMMEPVTDGFESYSAYSLDNFGGWRTYDGDQKNTYSSKYWNSVTNLKAPMAFEVWNNETVKEDGFFGGVGVSEDSFAAHSGNACLAAFTAMDRGWLGDEPSANDNWLFSPKVMSGTDVTFYAKNLSGDEILEVYYTTDADVDFTGDCLTKFELFESYTISEKDWREISFTLPAGAVRFAIRHCTQRSAYILLLDDFTYTPATGSGREVEIKGYNVYRNNALLGFTEGTEYVDVPEIGGQYVYYVTTVTDAGESSASNPLYAEITTAVEAIDNAGFSVRTVDGGIAISAESAACKVFTIDGVVVFDGVVKGEKKINCGNGVYIVNGNGVSRKLRVK